MKIFIKNYLIYLYIYIKSYYPLIFINLNDITLFYLSYLHFYYYKNFEINLVI